MATNESEHLRGTRFEDLQSQILAQEHKLLAIIGNRIKYANDPRYSRACARALRSWVIVFLLRPVGLGAGLFALVFAVLQLRAANQEIDLLDNAQSSAAVDREFELLRVLASRGRRDATGDARAEEDRVRANGFAVQALSAAVRSVLANRKANARAFEGFGPLSFRSLNLSVLDLSGCDFSGVDISAVDFAYSSLDSAIFGDQVANGVCFDHADLTRSEIGGLVWDCKEMSAPRAASATWLGAGVYDRSTAAPTGCSWSEEAIDGFYVLRER